MKNLKRYFQGVQPGTVCTGTIHFFGLQAKELLEAKIIRDDGRDYIFLGLDPKPVEDPVP